MFLSTYFSEESSFLKFTREQASHFAKKVAGDFNPIHDEDNKRFCVPGDLLFSVFLSREGISKKMCFEFSEMVSDGVRLTIKKKADGNSTVVDDLGKEYLKVSCSGEKTSNIDFVEHVVTNYVKFSGMSFPHIMVPLMEAEQVMINSQRPLVIYESMEVEFTRLDLTHPEVEFSGASLDVQGKRGFVTLNFDFIENDVVVGKGVKRMVASGLKPYCQDSIDDLVNRFNIRKVNFITNEAA